MNPLLLGKKINDHEPDQSFDQKEQKSDKADLLETALEQACFFLRLIFHAGLQ